jgi:hypothetical protein
MARNKSSKFHLRKSYQILLIALVIAWVLSAFSLLSVPPYAVSIILVLAVALIWG